MAWSVPFTAVAGGVLTAAQLNTFVRDNLNETMPARATWPSSIFAVSDQNEIVERTPGVAQVPQTAEITATSFDDPNAGLSGPSVTVATGRWALLSYRANLRVPSATSRVEMSYAVTGATDLPAYASRSVGYSQSNAASGYQQRMGVMDLATGLVPGENTFTLKYSVSAGTGFADDRRLWVLPL